MNRSKLVKAACPSDDLSQNSKFPTNYNCCVCFALDRELMCGNYSSSSASQRYFRFRTDREIRRVTCRIEPNDACQEPR